MQEQLKPNNISREIIKCSTSKTYLRTNLTHSYNQQLSPTHSYNLCFFSELAILNLSGNFLVSAHPEWFDVVVHNLKSSNERIKNEVGIENNSWKCDCSLLDLKVRSIV